MLTYLLFGYSLNLSLQKLFVISQNPISPSPTATDSIVGFRATPLIAPLPGSPAARCGHMTKPGQWDASRLIFTPSRIFPLKEFSFPSSFHLPSILWPVMWLWQNTSCHTDEEQDRRSLGPSEQPRERDWTLFLFHFLVFEKQFICLLICTTPY